MKRQAPPLWKTIPLFRILVPFMTGLLMQECFPMTFLQLSLGLACTSILWMGSHLKNSSWHYFHPLARGMVLHLAVLFSGALLLQAYHYKNRPEWIGHNSSSSSLFIAELEEPLVPKANSIGGKATFIANFSKGRWQPVKGKILVYFKPDSIASKLEYGSRIVFGKKLQPIRSSGNPGSFDFAIYASRQNRFHQVYLSAGEYRIIYQTGGNWFYKNLYLLRAQMLSIFRKHLLNREELGLTEALVLGVKDDLDKELALSYAATGTVHIIAISGLHLGLIYWLLNLLMGRLRLPSNLKLVKSALILSSLWGFALLAGGGPSVLRSAIMFSLVLFAKNLFRYSSTLNSLCVAAFLLLLYNPYWLWDTGFQLSFAAVLSIAIYQSPLNNLFNFKNGLLHYGWSATAVTLAAQVLTLPFCLYYFHQFPVYFLFTNLLAVPLSSVILLTALLLLASAPFGTMAVFISQVLHWMLSLLNGFIRFMEHLPFSSWKPLQVSLCQSLLLAIFLALFTCFLAMGKRVYLFCGLSGLLAFLVLRAFSFHEAAQQQLLLVYQTKGFSLVEKVKGFHAAKIMVPGKISQLNSMNDPSMAAGVLFRYKCQKSLLVDSSTSFIMNLGKEKLVLLQSNFWKKKPNFITNCRWLLITGNCKGPPEKILSFFKPGLVLVDGSNPSYRLQAWKQACDSFRLPFYSTEERGAFVMPLE